jgi:phytol kinase
MTFGLTVLAVFLLLIASEWWWRRHSTHGEFSRKFIHITVGSFVAFWPFFLSWGQIQLLSLAFLVTILVSKWLQVFQSIHSVQRPTWGEVFFALAVGSITLITHDKWIYMAALLQMSLADGFAALIGVKYSKTRYTVLGHTKSRLGTITFAMVSFLILLTYGYIGGNHLEILPLVTLPIVAAGLENFGAAGFDNLTVPVLVATVLTLI